MANGKWKNANVWRFFFIYHLPFSIQAGIFQRPAQMTPCDRSVAAGVLSKMTAPRSGAAFRVRVRRRDHHHAPIADPIMPARMP
jgi:hypothetical protein